MDQKYNAVEIEKKWYAHWLKMGYFKADNKSEKKPFAMIMPPLNVTGELHLGHALQHTITDILIRAKRMQGFDALWLPGTDHAGIQMQGTMEKKLEKEEKKTRAEIGDQAFLKYIWRWARIYQKKILEQSQSLGESADWSRKTFTLDPGPANAVSEEFIRLYNEGLIYRGPYIVHYCTRCLTAITDLELEYKEREGELYYIQYPLPEARIGNRKSGITVATTRPETMLGDTAVAVHPDDQRYKDLVGKKVLLPLTNREIPIIADESVDIKFGTGAVKVTPGHDLSDYTIGERHKLETLTVIDRDGRMTNAPRKYQGLTTKQAREIIIEDLKKLGLLQKTEKIMHNVALCERCKTVVEPRISVQWFVKMKELARPAIAAIREEKVKFLPERYKKQALGWLNEIRDWCVSRQLVWGHPMPVYYCDCSDKPIVSAAKPKVCPLCKSKKITQEKDVLDTWFSSGLWPFSTLGWPKNTVDLAKYYPSDVMVTAPGILYLWICRMIILGLKFRREIPFRTVFIHGTLRDEQGRKMSKSLGNGVNPQEMIDRYGADSARFALAQSSYPGRDIKMSKQAMEDKIRSSRNFVTKIYNASKLIIEKTKPAQGEKMEAKNIADRWILDRLDYTIRKITEYLEAYQIAKACRRFYKFFWNELCDWYLEIAKEKIYNEDPKKQKEASLILRQVLRKSLKLLHPLMPFLSEELYHNLGFKKDLIISAWPKINNIDFSSQDKQEFKLIQEIVIAKRVGKKADIKSLSEEGQKIVEYLTRNIK